MKPHEWKKLLTEGKKLVKEADAGKYILANSFNDKDVLKILFSEYNRDIKRKKLKKLGFSNWAIDQLEDAFRQAYLQAAKKVGAEVKDNMKDNFGKVGVYLGQKTKEFTDELKKELSKTKVG